MDLGVHAESVYFTFHRFVASHDSRVSAARDAWGKHVNVCMKYAFTERPYLQIPAVALLSLLHVTVSTLLSSVEHLHLRHVKQTHAHAFLQTRRQIFLTARTEDRGERVPEATEEIRYIRF